MNSYKCWSGFWSLFAYLTCCLPHAISADRLDYAKDVYPIFEKYCVGCHTSDDPSGMLVMESFDQLISGGEHGPVITPGVPDSSRLFLMASGKLEPVMPPDDMEGPNAEELNVLRLWIEQGAIGPEQQSMPRRTLRTPKVAAAEDVAKPITAMAMSPDGKELVIARFGTLEIRSTATQELLGTLSDLTGKINDVRFSRDGSQLVVASGITGLYGQVELYDWTTKQVLRKLDGHRDTLYAAAISPDGRWIASGGYDRDVQLWDAKSGELVRTLRGHNGAIFDLQFSAVGNVLASASADETVKLWRIPDGERLDTLSQPQAEVWAVAFSPDDQHIVAASADNRFRVWQFQSRDEARLNTLVETRFADDAPLVNLAFTPDGQRLLVASEAGRVGVFETQHWAKLVDLGGFDEAVSDLCVAPNDDSVFIALMNGELHQQTLELSTVAQSSAPQRLAEVYLQVDAITDVTEQEGPHDSAHTAMPLPRGAKVSGVIKKSDAGVAEEDCYSFFARAGEVWLIETMAGRSGSPLDTRIEITDSADQPIVRTKLQAIRDSYFTFRGKDSTQSADFRLFGWEEMELNDYLYSSGEVTRLWLYPRGPDSGFNVYPGTGNRHTYFDTNPVTHALQEPAYIVRELAADESPIANGLPVFTIYYANDDDALQQWGTDSRIRFVAPRDANFIVRVTDSRGLAGDDFRYDLTIRPANPDFKPFVDKIGKPIPAGAGREFRVRIDRLDGFQGPVTFEVSNLPAGIHATESVTVEANQFEAYGVVWADEHVAVDQDFGEPQLIARGEILGRVVERNVGGLGNIKSAAKPQVRLSITPDGEAVDWQAQSPAKLIIHPGQTISAMIHVERNGLDGEIKLGNEFSGRNMSHGVFVDNIGLNGLMILKGANEHQFFITAAPIATPGQRLFHLKAEVDGGVTSLPVMLEVVP